jgi:fibronectin-binding autotransporter adhesin
MAKQIVNVGTNQDDGTGDNLRDAFVKVNANFTEIYSELGGTSLSNLRFSGSTITTDATNTSIILDPQGVGKITLNGDTHIAGNINATAAMVLSGNLNVGGGTTLTSTINVAGATTLSSTLDVTGASTFTGNVIAVNLATTGNTDLGNATSDTITATGRFDSNIVPSASATYDLGTSSLRWNNLYAVNANISGDITLGGNLVGGDANTDTITLNAELTSDIVPDVDSIYSLGSTSKRWENVWVDKVTAMSLHSSGIEISDTTIKTSTTNNDLTLTASGTGVVVIDSVKISDLTASRLALVGTNGALQDDGDFTYLSQVTGGTLTAKFLSSEKITVDSMQLDGNTLSTTTGSLILSPVTDQGVSVNSEKILNLATPTLGTDAANKAYVDTVAEYTWTLTDDASGIALIQNTEDLKIVSGSGITSVLSYGSPGHILTITNTDTLADVLARGNEARSITSAGHVDVGKITVDQQIRINTNRIETLLSNSDLELSTSGTGQIWIRDANAQIDGTLAVTSTSTFTGATTHTGGVIVPNDGFVGSAGELEAIKIASDGDVVFKNDITATGIINGGLIRADSNISLNGNKIFTAISNSDIDIDPAGTGSVNMRAHVILQNQSGDPSGVTDASHIYAKDDTTSEVYVRDEAGNVTKISPHNNNGEWEYYSRNIKTGKVMRVNMERMVRKLEEITGETFIEEI